jgi:hypothetical protein
MFHGAIIPMYLDNENPTVGRATADIVEGFLARGKHVYCWCPADDVFTKVEAIEVLPDQDYVSWARLDFSC